MLLSRSRWRHRRAKRRQDGERIAFCPAGAVGLPRCSWSLRSIVGSAKSRWAPVALGANTQPWQGSDLLVDLIGICLVVGSHTSDNGCCPTDSFMTTGFPLTSTGCRSSLHDDTNHRHCPATRRQFRPDVAASAQQLVRSGEQPISRRSKTCFRFAPHDRYVPVVTVPNPDWVAVLTVDEQRTAVVGRRARRRRSRRPFPSDSPSVRRPPQGRLQGPRNRNRR